MTTPKTRIISHRLLPKLCMYLSSCFCASLTLRSASSTLASILSDGGREGQRTERRVSCASHRRAEGLNVVPLHLLALLGDEVRELLEDRAELVDCRLDRFNFLVPRIRVRVLMTVVAPQT